MALSAKGVEEGVAVPNPRVAMTVRMTADLNAVMTVDPVMDPEMKVDPVTEPEMSVEVNMNLMKI